MGSIQNQGPVQHKPQGITGEYEAAILEPFDEVGISMIKQRLGSRWLVLAEIFAVRFSPLEHDQEIEGVQPELGELGTCCET